MRKIVQRAAFITASLFFWGLRAHAADCTDPTAAVGTVMYNQDYDAFQGCTAVKGWVVFNPPGHPSGGGSDPTGCGAIGDVCSDGTVYAGLSPDGNVKMYATPADAPSTYKWATTNTDTAVVNCSDSGAESGCATGQANQAILAGLGSGYQAAAYCAALTADGHSDWYLPAFYELTALYTNRAAIGGFSTGSYWSSSENSANFTWYQDFTGSHGYANKSTTTRKVRCVRR